MARLEGNNQLGKPVQNAFAESHIGRLRDEFLNETLLPTHGWNWRHGVKTTITSAPTAR